MLQWQLGQLALTGKSDVVVIYGPMHIGLPAIVRDEIEEMAENGNNSSTLTILLNTGGGLVDSVERTVGVIRQHYEFVVFIIPDQDMLAGTIFALSGGNIYMDYYSQLGQLNPVPRRRQVDTRIAVLGGVEREVYMRHIDAP